MKKVHLPAAALLALVAHAAPLHAQEAPEEIVVTATMRDTSAALLPGNVAVLSDVPFLQADHPSDALNRLPGVNIQHGSGQEHLTSIRSPVLTGGAGAGSFLYLEDGIPLRSAGFANVNGLFEAHTEQVGRIEVIRGPGSALYGSNAVHGLINVTSQAPDSVENPVVSLNYGSHDQTAFKLAAPFRGDGANALLNLTLKHDGGARASSGYDQQKVTLRNDWQAGDNSLTVLVAFTNLNQETAGYIQGYEAYKNKRFAKTNPFPEAFRDAHALRAYARWDHERGDGTTISLTPYYRQNDMRLLMHFLPSQALEDTSTASLGLNARAYKPLSGGHEIIAGVDVERTEGDLYEYQDIPTVFSYVTGLHYDYEIVGLVVSPYVHSEWSLGENTRLTAGLRYDHTEYDYDNLTDNNTVGRFQRISDRTDRFDTLTPKLAILHQLSDEVTLFGNLVRGQRAPQTTDLYRIQINQTPGDADPETLDSLEIGVRDVAGKLRYEATAFYMKKENLFFRDSDGFNVSDGKTEHLGVELSFFAMITDALDIAGSVTWAEHTYAFDNEVAANSTEDIRDGNAVDTAPKILGNLRLGLHPRDNMRAELEWVHMDKYYIDGANTHSYEGHDLLNLRMEFTLNERVSLQGRILNLTDEAYADRADFAFGSYRYFPGERRFFGLGVTYRM